MPRVARGLADWHFYHIINRGNGRQDVFHKEEDFAAFVDLLEEALQRYPVDLFAYCLMTNHFHLLVRPQKGKDLSRFMQWFMTSHVRRYHRHYRSSGHIWQGRYKSFVVQDDDHLLTVARYIESNPLRAKMVSKSADWPWSSLGTGSPGTGSQRVPVPVSSEDGSVPVSGEADSNVSSKRDRHPAGASPRITPLPVEFTGNWEEFVDQPFSQADQAKLRQSITRQAPFGNEEWQFKIAGMLGLLPTLNPLGRPQGTGSR